MITIPASTLLWIIKSVVLLAMPMWEQQLAICLLYMLIDVITIRVDWCSWIHSITVEHNCWLNVDTEMTVWKLETFVKRELQQN